MNYYFCFLLIFAFAIQSCRKPLPDNEIIDTLYDAQGILISKPYKYKIPITINSTLDNGGAIYGTVPYKGKGMVLKLIENDFTLCLIDTIDGSSAWETPLNVNSHIYYFFKFYQKDSFYYTIKSDILGINLENGEVNMLKTDKGYFKGNAISGIDEFIFFTASDSFPNNTYNHTGYGFYYNTSDGNSNKFLTPRYHIPEDSIYKRYYKGISGIYPIKIENEIYLSVNYYHDFTNQDYYNYPSIHFQQYFGLYSLGNDKWIYDSIPVGNSLGEPYIEGGRIYSYTTTSANCWDLMTGQLIWEKEYPFKFDGAINYSVYGNTYVLIHQSGFILGLDKDTGYERWRTPSSITVDFFQEYNGVLYYVNAGRASIHAVDVQTGKMLWLLNSPDPSGFVYCTVIPGKDGGKGRIIACSYDYAYCYETER